MNKNKQNRITIALGRPNADASKRLDYVRDDVDRSLKLDNAEGYEPSVQDLGAAG